MMALADTVRVLIRHDDRGEKQVFVEQNAEATPYKEFMTIIVI